MARFKQSPAVLKIIDFSRRHKWAKLLCVGAVSINYAGDVISSKIYGPVTKIKKTAEEISVPLSRRVVSGLACAAFSVMILPFNAVDAYAAEEEIADDDTEDIYISAESSETEGVPETDGEYTENAGETESDGSDGDIVLPAAADSELYTKMIGLAEIAADNAEYDESSLQTAEESEKDTAVKVNVTPKESEDDKVFLQISIKGGFENDSMSMTDIGTDENRQLEVLYRSSEGKKAVSRAFDSYGIPHENMNISAFEISVYDGGKTVEPEENVKIYIEVPDDMINHREDLKAVRLNADRIEILDSVYARNKNGDLYISFETDHFSTFALVSYADQPENLESEAGENDVGTPVNGSMTNILGEIKEGKPAAKRKKYRVTKKIRKCDLIF